MSLPNVPVSQVVTFLAALAPVGAAALGVFNGLPNNVQVALAYAIPIGIAAVLVAWLCGRARYVSAVKQVEASQTAQLNAARKK